MRLRVALGTALLAGAALLAAPAAAQRPVVQVADAGPGRVGGIVNEVLARPHRLVPPSADSTFDMPRGATVDSSVVVLARDVTVASRVRGDLLVVGGDIFLHPGAVIEGRAIAVGGGVYNSTLAQVHGARVSFRDETFDVVPVAGGYELRYRSLIFRETPFLTWPGLYGLRLPDYDRVNGLSIGAGPFLSVQRGRLEVGPVLTYRSHLGALDPEVEARLRLSRRTRLEGWIGRETRSTEEWILSDLLNSASSLVLGRDTRNYYRADAAELRAHRRWEWSTGMLEPFVGAAAEHAWSTGPSATIESRPWSLFGRNDREDGMLRPNPGIDAGTISSALAGARLEWESQGVSGEGTVRSEAALRAPGAGRFVQTTVDGKVAFPTFGTQSLRFEAHLIVTAADTAPRQRWGWIGGSGTVPLMELLEQGGDQLLFVESRYLIPIERVKLPLVGSPTLMVRHVMGGAAVGRWPRLEQNLGLRLTVAILRGELLVDPAEGKPEFHVGIALTR